MKRQKSCFLLQFSTCSWLSNPSGAYDEAHFVLRNVLINICYEKMPLHQRFNSWSTAHWIFGKLTRGVYFLKKTMMELFSKNNWRISSLLKMFDRVLNTSLLVTTFSIKKTVSIRDLATNSGLGGQVQVGTFFLL